MSWGRVFNRFFAKFRLDEELKRIEHWIDFREFNNIWLYLRSPNMQSDSLGCGCGNRDTCLETVCKWDEDCQLYQEESDAIMAMDADQRQLFFIIYVLHRHVSGNQNWRLKDDLLVLFASKDTDYVFADVIITEYEAIKSKFDEKFQSDFERRKDIFNEILISKSYLLPDKWKNTDFECGGNASRRKHLIYLADMLDEGELTEDDFKSMASVLPYGKKYVKFVLEQINNN
ncbi:hypothetical protein [uncultured Holdemanella sp.]|uniref:hypothetical protein n=1 Tax=uncultured Holdemanella sp. TaxID=1763549 RepID=UPI00258B5F02|nr:hypothetical protein [uncultured Holdemanella sp.]